MNKKVNLAPFAVASNGTVFANVAHVVGDVALTKLLQQAQRMGGGLFIGVAVTSQHKKALLRALDNAGAETVAKTVGRHLHHGMRRSRRSSGRSR